MASTKFEVSMEIFKFQGEPDVSVTLTGKSPTELETALKTLETIAKTTTLYDGNSARTAALLLALANQILSAFGKSPLPIESSTVEQLVTTGITTVTALINWWYNNSFTQAAIEGDKTYENVKNQIH